MKVLWEKIKEALEQLTIATLEKGEGIAIPEARKQIALYFRDFHGSARLRAEINQARTYAEVEGILKSVLE